MNLLLLFRGYIDKLLKKIDLNIENFALSSTQNKLIFFCARNIKFHVTLKL